MTKILKERWMKLAGIDVLGDQPLNEEEGQARPARSTTTKKVPSHIQARWDKRAEERRSGDLNEEDNWTSENQADFDQARDLGWHELFELFNKVALNEVEPEEVVSQVDELLAKGVVTQDEVEELSRDVDISLRAAKAAAKKGRREALRRMKRVWKLVK